MILFIGSLLSPYVAKEGYQQLAVRAANLKWVLFRLRPKAHMNLHFMFPDFH